jgi:hypothetical protein
MAVVPNPRTWSPGETPLASQLNTELRDSWAFFTNPPRCKVYSTTGQTITTGTDQLMVWNTEIYDTDGMFAANRTGGSSDSRITIVTAGIYQVMLHLNWTAVNDSSPGNRYVGIKLNQSGSATLQSGLTSIIGNDASRINNSNTSIPQTSHISMQMYLAQNDYIEAIVGTTFSGVTTVSSGAESRSFFGARWIGVI